VTVVPGVGFLSFLGLNAYSILAYIYMHYLWQLHYLIVFICLGVPDRDDEAVERDDLRRERAKERQRDRNLARAAPDKRYFCSRKERFLSTSSMSLLGFVWFRSACCCCCSGAIVAVQRGRQMLASKKLDRRRNCC
jgi:hypothetical protein